MSSSNAMDEDAEVQSHELPENYLSPRSKVARMLQDIEEASTTSSPAQSPGKHATPTTHRSSDVSITASSHVRNEERDAESGSEDDDIIPRRPTGKALRRMLIHEPPAADTSSIPIDRQHDPLDSPTTQHSDTLFVSPAKSTQDQASDSDEDLPANPFTNRRLADLVAAKRAERLEREQTERDRSEEGVQPQSEGNTELPEEMVEDAQHVPVNAELEKILSDSARPTRKASKKAMLEMERETQRIAREQALTHQMKVKKKFSTSDLFARFKFRQPLENSHNPDHPISDSSSATQGSDAADAAHLMKEPVSTPPSSPPTPWDRQKAIVEHGALARIQPVREDSLTELAMPEHVDVADDDNDLSNVADIIKQSKASKANSVQQPPESPSRSAARNSAQKKQRLHMTATRDDGEELEVLPRMPPHLRMFDRVKPSSKETNNRAIHVLKHLAHLNQDPSAGARKKVSKFVAPDLVNAQLLSLARVQARQAQDERLTELKAKGVVIMSVEEQEKEAEQFENLLEKERLKVAQLGKKERAAARNENGEEVVLNVSDDESEDADFEDDDDVELDEEASEDEPEDNLVEGLAEEAEAEASDLEVEDVDDVDKEEVQVNVAESVHEDPQDTAAQSITSPVHSARAAGRDRKSRIVFDDEEDSDASIEQQPSADEASTQPEDPFAAFGFGNEPSMHLLSPTQAFKATMQTPSQQTQLMQDQGQTQSSTQDQPGVGYFVIPSAELESTAPLVVAAQVEDESQTQLVPASQVESQDKGLDLHWETMPETPLTKAGSMAQETPGWQPSQDAGLPSPWTEIRRQATQNALQADEEHETQSTVRVRISESPEVILPKKKGRLTKGVRAFADTETAAKRDAFAEMQRIRMESMNASERAEAEREARAMMDEQAEESEDEYAGLGGDDSNMIAPENAEDRAMFDETEQEVDEQAMAKFYAERQREAEEKATSKLFNDLTTGGLRRRQGVGWDLEEDEDERAARRRQMRQREEARKRKLLLQDENVKDLVESKGNSKGREAFLRTIGDDDDDLESYSIDTEETLQSQDTATQPLQEISSNKRPSESTSERPLKSRRIDDQLALTKPTSMLQVRESLSFLLDGPEEFSFGPSYLEDEQDEASQDDDGDEEAIERARSNDGGYAPDRAMPPPPLPSDRLPANQRRTPAKSAVIDRLSLRRAGSSSSSASGASAWSTSSQNGSKAPSLLRRATSNLSAASANDSVKLASNQRTKIGGSKKSSLAYQARAQERRAIGERAEKKRDEGRRKIAQMRREQGGALVTGAFGATWE